MVLLAEDEPVLRRVITRMIGSLGLPVTAVASAEAAMAELQNAQGPVILLTDYHLGTTSGVELAMHAIAMYEDLEVIVISGSCHDDIPTGGIPPDRLRGVLEKPFRMEDLRGLLSRDPSGAERS